MDESDELMADSVCRPSAIGCGSLTMHVLCTNVRLDALGGGTSERTVQLARSLVRRSLSCSILTTDVGLTDERLGEMPGVEIAALPCLSRRFYVPRSGFQRIRRMVEQADVVHMMGLWNVLNTIAYRYARRSGVPHVVCPAGDLPVFGRSIYLKKAFYRFAGRRIVTSARRVIAITPGEIPHFRRAGIDEQHVTVIPNGVCAEDLLERDDGRFRRSHGIGEAPIVLFVGRLAAIKGPDLLLESFGRIKDRLPHHLVFAGPDGGLLDELKRSAVAAGIADRVHFTGFLPGAEKSRAYHAAELLVIPSRSEAMSIVVLEAGCTATPVLLTDRCGFDEVGDIGGGRVVAATTEALERGLLEMLTPPLRSRLGDMGRRLQKFVDSGYTWDVIVERHIQLFQRIRNEG